MASAISLKLVEGHGEGQASVAYCKVKNEFMVVTCGADGTASVRDNFLLEPQYTCKSDMPPAGAMAVDPTGTLLAMGDEQYVKLYKLPSLEFERVACRFSLPVRALAFSPDGAMLAAGGDDTIIKLVDAKAGTVVRTVPLEDQVLSLAWDPEGQFLAAAQRMTGALLVVDAKTGKTDKRLDQVMEKVDLDGLRRHGVSWHPDGGALLAAPLGSEGEVVLYERLSWEASGWLSGEHQGPVNCVVFSPNGLYAATAGTDKKVLVWEVQSAEVVAAAETSDIISGLAWHPKGNELALVSEAGSVGVWTNPVPEPMPGPAVTAEELMKMQRHQEALADAKREAAKAAAGGVDGDDSALLGAAGEGGAEGAAVALMELDGDAAQLLEGGAEAGLPEASEAGGGVGTAGAQRAAAAGGVRRPGLGLGLGLGGMQAPVQTIVKTIIQAPPGPAPQPAFQPGSTPPEASGSGKAHFLAYNSIGSVASRPVDDHHVVEVVFHDAARHSLPRVPLLTDLWGFTRAALSEKGVLYSSPAAGAEAGGGGGDAVPSMVVFRPFESWAVNSDWSVGLPSGEEALCLAAGHSFLAVATSRQLLRLFSLAGCQTLVCRLEGPPVAMAAHGPLLLVAWHAGPPNTHTKCQQLAVAMYDTTTFACAFQQPLPLPPGATLSWLGFSEEGLPAMADSGGCVCVRTPDYGGRWVPVFEAARARKSSEVFWPVGLDGHHLLAIVCKPEQPRPQVSPRPFFTPLALQVPVLAAEGGGGGSASQQEGEVLRLALGIASCRARYEAAEASGSMDAAAAAHHALLVAQTAQDGALLRALRDLVRADRHARALEVAAQINSYKALEGAAKVANHHHARALAERIGALMTQRQEISLLEEGAPLTGGGEGASMGGRGGGGGRQHALTPIPFAIRRGGGGSPLPAGHGQPREQPPQQPQQQQPLAAADLNLPLDSQRPDEARQQQQQGGAAAARGGKPALTVTPGGSVPTPNTLLAAAGAKADGDALKRKPEPQAFNNPFTRKLKVAKS